ncbi:MAG: hypothetical protein KA522_00040 [Candidatus Saccharicenans sp.]|nr:hypothetical protein [Candidatus Saccharicenans sp.]
MLKADSLNLPDTIDGWKLDGSPKKLPGKIFLITWTVAVNSTWLTNSTSFWSGLTRLQKKVKTKFW